MIIRVQTFSRESQYIHGADMDLNRKHLKIN